MRWIWWWNGAWNPTLLHAVESPDSRRAACGERVGDGRESWPEGKGEPPTAALCDRCHRRYEAEAAVNRMECIP
jgi:hypothetical protein